MGDSRRRQPLPLQARHPFFARRTALWGDLHPDRPRTASLLQPSPCLRRALTPLLDPAATDLLAASGIAKAWATVWVNLPIHVDASAV